MSLTYAAEMALGVEDAFSDFYETTFEATSGRSEVNLCVVALALLKLAQKKQQLESDVCDQIVQFLTAPRTAESGDEKRSGD